MPKEISLIEGGVINPSDWQLEQVKAEIAAIVGVKETEIASINYWMQQIWVKLVGRGSKFVSYRSLSLWFDCTLLAILTCEDVLLFDKLGAMLRYEFNHYAKYYSSDKLTQLQQAWQSKLPQFQTEQARILLQLAIQQEGQKWQKNCLQLLSTCRDINSLRKCYSQLMNDGKEFEGLPEILATVDRFYYQRLDELNQSGDFWTPF